MVVADQVGQRAEQFARVHQRGAEHAVIGLVLPLKLRQPRVDQGLGDAAVVKNGGLKQVIQAALRPASMLGDFCGNVGDPLAMVDVGDADQAQRIGQGVDCLVQIDAKARQCSPP